MNNIIDIEMKKISYYLRCAAIISSVGLILSSCDKEFDLSKDINTDLSIGSSFSVPVGHTTKVNLSRIIKESATISPGTNSVYEVVTSGTTSSSVNLSTVSFNITPMIGSVNINVPSITPAAAIKGSQQIDAGQISMESDPYNVNAKLPKEIEKLYRATLKNAETYLTIKLDSESWPVGIDKVVLKNFKISFPEILHLSGGGNVFSYGSDIVISADSRTVTLTIPFDYADIPEEKQSQYVVGADGDKSFVLNERLKVSADVQISISGVPQVNALTILFDNKAQGDVTVAGVAGVFNTDANINETIDINDIPDFLKNGTSSFTPNEVNFYLSLNNTLALPWNLNLGLESLKDNGQKSEMVNVPINANPGKNNILISNKQNADVVVPKLPELFKFIPDHFIISSPTDIILRSAGHTDLVELGREYVIDATYDVAIPFSFSKMKIEYSDDIDNLADDLDDVLDKVDTKNLIIDAVVETDIPVAMTAGVKLYDQGGNLLDDGIKVDLEKFVVNGDASGSVSTSPVTIKLTQVKEGYFKRLDRIEYTINADNVGNNVTLRSNQYVQVKDIVVRIPNAIKVTL